MQQKVVLLFRGIKNKRKHQTIGLKRFKKKEFFLIAILTSSIIEILSPKYSFQTTPSEYCDLEL